MRKRVRLRLIHWHAGEAAERAAVLTELGFLVDASSFAGMADFKALTRTPPDAVVIDLSRLPSHGRDVGVALREARATRGVPLIFVGGGPDKVGRTRQTLPDAAYCAWPQVAAAVARALAKPLVDPVVPSSRLAGYSGTPLVKKLGIKPHSVLALIGAPRDFRATLGELPAGVTVRTRATGACDTVIWFLMRRRDLERGLAGKIAALAPGGGLWLTWPKRASGVATDVTQAAVREAGLAAGLVDHKIAAIDATWSGLRFVRRRTG